MTADGDAAMTYLYQVEELDTETYSVSSATGNEITNQFDSSAVQWTEDLNNLYKDDPDICQAMRQATHRILYTVANSNAMNGISSSQEVVAVTPWWETALYTLCVVCGLMTVVGVVQIVRSKKKKEEA